MIHKPHSITLLLGYCILAVCTQLQAPTTLDLTVYGMHSPFLTFGVEKLVPLAQPGLIDLKIDINTGHVTLTIMGASIDLPHIYCAIWNAGFLASDQVTISGSGTVVRDTQGNYLFKADNDENTLYLAHPTTFKTLTQEVQKNITTLAKKSYPAQMTGLFVFDYDTTTYQALAITNLAPLQPPVCCPK